METKATRQAVALALSFQAGKVSEVEAPVKEEASCHTRSRVPSGVCGCRLPGLRLTRASLPLTCPRVRCQGEGAGSCLCGGQSVCRPSSMGSPRGTVGRPGFPCSRHARGSRGLSGTWQLVPFRRQRWVLEQHVPALHSLGAGTLQVLSPVSGHLVSPGLGGLGRPRGQKVRASVSPPAGRQPSWHVPQGGAVKASKGPPGTLGCCR